MKKKIDFLTRLFSVAQCRDSLLEYLREEKLITKEAINAILIEHHTLHATSIVHLLETLYKEDKLHLLDYEWIVLPFERLKLTLVTRTGKKEFEYAT